MSTKTRLDRLSKVQERTFSEWKSAWDALSDLAYSCVPAEDRAVYRKGVDLFEEMLDGLSEEEERQLAATWERLVEGTPPEVREAWGAWQDAFYAARYAGYYDPPDLSTWPDTLPAPPEEPPHEWETLKGYVQKGDRFEAMGAGSGIVTVTWARGVRAHLNARTA